MFIGRIVAEAEAPILWPHDAKNWLIGKAPDAGKEWEQEEKGMAEDEMVGWHHQLNEHEFEQTLGLLRRRTGEPGQGYQKVGRDLVTEQQQQLVDNVTFTSDVQQNDSVIYIYIFFFFWILFHCRLSQDIEYSSLCYTVRPCYLF